MMCYLLKCINAFITSKLHSILFILHTKYLIAVYVKILNQVEKILMLGTFLNDLSGLWIFPLIYLFHTGVLAQM